MTQQLAAPPSTNGNGLAAPDKRMTTFKNLFDASRAQIAAVLPKHLTPERIMKVALVAISRTPKLQECSPMSVLQSVMTAAQLGLDCGGIMGQGYLVPYWNKKAGANECQFIPGYRGLIDLARRSGQVTSIEARTVYERDAFEWVCGLNPVLDHKPFLDGNAGEMRLVYAIAHFKEGGTHYEVMTIHEIDRIKDASPAGKYGPWVDHYEEMAKKTVIRRLCKYLPMSIEMAAAMEVGDSVDRGITADVLDGMVQVRDEQDAADREAPPPDRSSALAGRLAKPVASKPVETPPPAEEPSAAPDAPDPREAWDHWYIGVGELAESMGSTPEEHGKAMEKALLKVGKKGKGWETTPEWRETTVQAVRDRAGFWAYLQGGT